MLPDGGILVGGYSFKGNANVIALARLTAAGVFDTTSDTDGWNTIDLAGYNDYDAAIAIHADSPPRTPGRPTD